MHNSKSYSDVVTSKHHFNVILMWQGSKLLIWTEISHSLGLQKSTTNEIRLHEMVV